MKQNSMNKIRCQRVVGQYTGIKEIIHYVNCQGQMESYKSVQMNKQKTTV